MYREQTSLLRKHCPTLIFILCFLLTTASTKCWEDSGDPSDDFWDACPLSLGNDGFSMCCKTKYPFTNVCLGNGLCLQNETIPKLGLQVGIFRASCTDQSWKSPSCIKLCSPGYYMQVKQCDNGAYCCGTDNQAINATATRCCQEGNGFFLHDGTITKANGTASTIQAAPTTLPETSANVPSSTTSPAATVTPVPPSKKSDIGAIVGGTIGGLAALSILVAIVVLSFRRSRRRSQQETPTKELGGGSHVTHELHNKAVPWELGDTERTEKDGTPVRAIR